MLLIPSVAFLKPLSGARIERRASISLLAVPFLSTSEVGKLPASTLAQASASVRFTFSERCNPTELFLTSPVGYRQGGPDWLFNQFTHLSPSHLLSGFPPSEAIDFILRKMTD